LWRRQLCPYAFAATERTKLHFLPVQIEVVIETV
jgi:hypothetical protein